LITPHPSQVSRIPEWQLRASVLSDRQAGSPLTPRKVSTPSRRGLALGPKVEIRRAECDGWVLLNGKPAPPWRNFFHELVAGAQGSCIQADVHFPFPEAAHEKRTKTPTTFFVSL
jgi:hypothetical protein